MEDDELSIDTQLVLLEEEQKLFEIESEVEQEEEELEDMPPPRLSFWVDADGKKHHEIVVNIDNSSNNVFNKNPLDMIEPCSICFHPFSTQGYHRICSLPCGHLYGFSCIKKWLQTPSGQTYCPQCKTPCAYKDVILLYASFASAYQKTSTTRHFPFTKQGLKEFKEHERLRHANEKKMHAEDCDRAVEVLEHQRVVAKQMVALATQGVDIERAEELEHDNALLRQYNALHRKYDALDKRYDALGRRAAVLEQRTDVLEKRLLAYKPTLKFMNKMYKKHLAKQNNTEPSSAAALTCHKH